MYVPEVAKIQNVSSTELYDERKRHLDRGAHSQTHTYTNTPRSTVSQSPSVSKCVDSTSSEIAPCASHYLRLHPLRYLLISKCYCLREATC